MKRVVLAIAASTLITSCAGGGTPVSVAVSMDEWSTGLAREAVAGP